MYCQSCEATIAETTAACGAGTCVGCTWMAKMAQNITGENAVLKERIHRLESELDKQMSLNGQLINTQVEQAKAHTAELIRLREAAQTAAGPSRQMDAGAAVSNLTNAMEAASTGPLSCVYLIGEDIIESVRAEKHLLGMVGKGCVLRAKPKLIASHFDTARKLIREADADHLHVFLELGLYNLKDENFRSWKAKELAQEKIAGMETILATEKVETITWMTLPESGDLATPTITVNRVVEEYLDRSPDKFKVFNMRGIYRNDLRFRNGKLTRLGQNGVLRRTACDN